MKILRNFGQILIVQFPFTPVQPRINRCSSIHVFFITLGPNVSNKFI